MKIRLSNSEYIMVDIPQELTPQGLYGLIKRLQRIQKFFSEGDVFSLKNEKAESIDEGEQFTPVKQGRQSRFTDTNQNRNEAIKAVREYYHGDLNARQELARRKGLPLKRYSPMIHYARKKWKITPKEVGINEFNLYGKK